ncbi:MAG: hypothetical protein II565_10185 [Fibrobacter sp.]|nr:hypothetical protein [Fibrobacter sp.]
MKRFVLTTAFACLFLVLAACDDDESSFVRPGDDSSSSIEEESSSSDAPKSSESETSVSSSKAKSSSSVTPKSSESAKSSSSVIPASSGDLQSSSSKKESSSSTKSSSSSVTPKSSSSETSVSSSSAKSSSSSAKSSSSSAKSSSSSVTPKSSSSGYVPYDHMYDMGGIPYVLKTDYKTFVDERNGRSYYYLTIRGKNSKGEPDSVTVMTENLNIGTMIFYDDDQANDSKIERYCYDDDTTNCDRYGALYQWAEMMQLPSECNTKSCADLIQPNHQGICPDGWRLLTQDDFYIVLHSDNLKHGIEDVRAGSFGGYNYTGYSLVGAGYVWNRRLEDLGKGAYWFYPEEDLTNPERKAPADASGSSSKGLINDIAAKTHGFSVRCTKLEE